MEGRGAGGVLSDDGGCEVCWRWDAVSFLARGLRRSEWSTLTVGVLCLHTMREGDLATLQRTTSPLASKSVQAGMCFTARLPIGRRGKDVHLTLLRFHLSKPKKTDM